MPLWRYAHAIHRYAKLFLRLRGLAITRKVTPTVAARIRPKLITRAATMGQLRGVVKKSSGSIVQQFRVAFRNLVALHYAPPIAYKHAHARENLQVALEHRFRKIAGRQIRLSAFDRIRNVFASNAPTDYSLIHLPDDINCYEIGEFIGSGQNAAVYELSNVKNKCADNEDNRSNQLAVKMIYNFNFNEPAESLWTDCRGELVPLASTSRIPSGCIANFRPLAKPHPNIVKMHKAFLGEWKQLATAEHHYPAVLPSVENYGYVPENPRTLYVIMQRYQMTLADYMDKVALNYVKAHVTFGQLLEAIAYLYDQKISHRDLKANNILLNFDSEEQCPHLVISDFGCAFSTGSWKLRYSNANMELGGNVAHLPPEVVNAEPSEATWIDYSKADIWAAGLIGYEIFDRTWFSLRERMPNVNDVDPVRPLFIGTPLGRIMENMLQKDPTKRTDPNVAADVINLMLFRIGNGIVDVLNECRLKGWNIGHSINTFLASSSKTIRIVKKRIEAGLDDMISLYAAETIISRRFADPIESQLRTTFMGRIQRDHIWAAVDYFEDSD
ncbi:Serine/threonine-protein kinase pink-1, mitochondrial [Toxocara canis]|uniref:non-specific serine/threonine protein kinase n=1 Tax=Toxocara canis TaxID=6265 RepID=A0A0B2UVK5_TOXCA|nr:Serine/threonine-protein kinase pink-1, mitochondrial [Toxocara canis]